MHGLVCKGTWLSPCGSLVLLTDAGIAGALTDITQELHNVQQQLQYWKLEADAWKERYTNTPVQFVSFGLIWGRSI